MDMNCQQICKNFMQKDLTDVKIFQKVLGGYFFKPPVLDTVLETRLLIYNLVNLIIREYA